MANSWLVGGVLAYAALRGQEQGTPPPPQPKSEAENASTTEDTSVFAGGALAFNLSAGIRPQADFDALLNVTAPITPPSGDRGGQPAPNPQSVIVRRATDLSNYGAALAPVIIALGNGQQPDPLAKALLAGLSRAQWASLSVRDAFLRDACQAVSDFGGLSIRGSDPLWTPPCSGIHGNVAMMSPLGINKITDPDRLRQLMPMSPAPYIIELAGLYAHDSLMKGVAKKLGASIDPMKAIKSGLKGMLGAASSAASSWLSGKWNDKQLGKTVDNAIEGWINAGLQLIEDLLGKFEAELGRRSTELSNMQRIVEGMRGVLLQANIQTMEVGGGSIPQNDPRLSGPFANYVSVRGSRHADTTPQELRVWHDVVDRPLNFLGGVVPGPGFAAYRSALSGSFWVVSRSDCEVSFASLTSWKRWWEKNGISWSSSLE